MEWGGARTHRFVCACAYVWAFAVVVLAAAAAAVQWKRRRRRAGLVARVAAAAAAREIGRPAAPLVAQ